MRPLKGVEFREMRCNEVGVLRRRGFDACSGCVVEHIDAARQFAGREGGTGRRGGGIRAEVPERTRSAVVRANKRNFDEVVRHPLRGHERRGGLGGQIENVIRAFFVTLRLAEAGLGEKSLETVVRAVGVPPTSARI